jgi:UDP-N-acetylglucosamine transferase subunit ALG13
LIFVSVGTPNRPFNRLIEGVDVIADKLHEKIIAQIGYATYVPKRYEYFRFCSHENMLHYIRSASIVVCQAGFGIIGNCIRLNKPIILVPREFKYGEAIDKQYELAEYLASRHDSIVCLRDTTFLYDTINSLRNITVKYDYKTNIPFMINNFIFANLTQ